MYQSHWDKMTIVPALVPVESDFLLVSACNYECVPCRVVSIVAGFSVMTVSALDYNASRQDICVSPRLCWQTPNLISCGRELRKVDQERERDLITRFNDHDHKLTACSKA